MYSNENRVAFKIYPLTPALSPKGARGKGANLHAVQNPIQLDLPRRNPLTRPAALAKCCSWVNPETFNGFKS